MKVIKIIYCSILVSFVCLTLSNAQNLPKNDIISGMDKKERDDFVSAQLRNHKADKPLTLEIDISSLKILTDTVVNNDSLFRYDGSYYLIPQINNNLYFIKTDSVYKLIFDENLLAATFCNAMLVPMKNDYTFSIMHKMYGNKVEYFDIYSGDLYDYFSIGYDRYFGIEKIDASQLSGTLLFRDRESGVINMLLIKCTAEDLLGAGNIYAKLYTNIPQDNIENLYYDEYEKNRKK